MQPPVAKRDPADRTLHGETLVDEYAWLRDRDDPATLAYLEEENAYTEAATRHLATLREALFEEIRSRVQETDLSAPARRGEWWYATRTREGSSYPVYVRRRGAPEGPEEVLLDVNDLAAGHGYLRLGNVAVSTGQTLLAYSTDTDGSERYRLRIRNLASGADLPDEIPDTYYTAAWSADDRFLLYVTLDEAHRPYRVWRHELGTDPAGDALVFEETDERMFLGVGTTTDRAFVLIHSGSQVTSEVLALPASDLTGRPVSVRGRTHGVEYDVDHQGGRWLVVTTDGAPNGRLLSVAVDDPADEVELIPHNPLRRVSSVLALSRHAVVSGRHDGLTALTVLGDDGVPVDLTFDEPVYTVGRGQNLEHDTATLRIVYESLATPRRIIDVDLDTGARTLVRETPVLGGYDPADYVSERTWAVAGDGTRVPVSLIRRRETPLPAPLLLYGYGAYEIPTDPWFSHARISLLERGIIFAIAHVRGGGELGKQWYEDGKLAAKENTFDDFVAAAEHLVAAGFTTPERLAARGGSAGGLLMGAVANRRPDLFAAVVAEVPFVDVLSTMLDETLPLTVIEWEEWGNPAHPDAHAWMRRYSPYDNVRPGMSYPAMLVTAGLNDPRVSYWEPAKWVARLRATATNRGPLLLKTELGAGHGGPSGRYAAWRDEAFVMAFLLDRWRPAG